MNPRIDLSVLVPIEKMRGEDEKETEQLRAMHAEALQFLESFKWCHGIEESYIGLGVGGVVAVFLTRIRRATDDVDEWLWVVVGDIPPAYLSTVYCIDTAQALEGYIAEMAAWVRAVRDGASVDGLIPVNAPPTPEYAAMLDSRLRSLRGTVLSAYRNGRLAPYSAT